MVRAILGVVVGFVLIQAIVLAAIMIAYPVMGAEGAYKPGLWEASTGWVVMTLASGLVAAVLGGVICALISRRRSRAPLVLAGLVLALGLVLAVMETINPRPDPGPRTGTPTFAEAAEHSRQPVWVGWTFPFVGAIGVMGGAALTGRSTAAAPVPPTS